jgi:2-amino-4-hydroxy-6-hydroxymethyldihydropteridine diphosphokinase
MSAVEHTALVGIKILSSRGIAHLQQLVQSLRSEDEILAISSVYKIGPPEQRPELEGAARSAQGFFSLSLVIKIQTTRTAEDYMGFLSQTEQEWTEDVTRRATSIRLYFLTFDNNTHMTPELTLPYPDLHKTPELLIPAAEVWGDYVHPVLDSSLFTLTHAMKSHAWGEFYAQGKSLLDF